MKPTVSIVVAGVLLIGGPGFAASPLEALPVGPGDPLCEHGQRAARLLVLRERLPLALEDGQRRWVEGVARLETAAEEVAGPGLGSGGVHGGPLRRQLRAALEAPVGIGFRHVLAGPLAAKILEQAIAEAKTRGYISSLRLASILAIWAVALN